MSTSSQKFIARNRAPRVQIEYDVELYGAQKKVQLPFVMGVMSDLSGNPVEPLPAVADRKFLEISVDNFDERLKAIESRRAPCGAAPRGRRSKVPRDLRRQLRRALEGHEAARRVPGAEHPDGRRQ